MILREPVLISTVTAIPGPSLTSFSSTCMSVRASETRAAYSSSWPFGSLVLVAAPAGRSFGAFGCVSRVMASDRHAEHFGMKEPVAREFECVDLDFRVLTGMNEPDIAIGHPGLDLKTGSVGTTTPSGWAGVSAPPTV
jgi:hypothetical protein